MGMKPNSRSEVSVVSSRCEEHAGSTGQAEGRCSPIEPAAVAEALRRVIDPELGVNIVDLGLVYGIETTGDGDVRVSLTMTTPVCPLSAYIKSQAADEIRRAVRGCQRVEIELVWQPPWSPAMMSAEARRQLGWRGRPT